jgi:hypothetical protein
LAKVECGLKQSALVAQLFLSVFLYWSFVLTVMRLLDSFTADLRKMHYVKCWPVLCQNLSSKWATFCAEHDWRNEKRPSNLTIIAAGMYHFKTQIHCGKIRQQMQQLARKQRGLCLSYLKDADSVTANLNQYSLQVLIWKMPIL